MVAVGGVHAVVTRGDGQLAAADIDKGGLKALVSGVEHHGAGVLGVAHPGVHPLGLLGALVGSGLLGPGTGGRLGLLAGTAGGGGRGGLTTARGHAQGGAADGHVGGG